MYLRFVLLGWLALALGPTGRADPLSVTPLNPAQPWSLLEWRVEGVPATTNPFDPDLTAVDASLTAPSGKQWTVPGFWYAPYRRALVSGQEVLSSDGPSAWRIRFTPVEPGVHRFVVTVRTNGTLAGRPLNGEFTVLPSVSPPAQPGFVRIGAAGQYFETDQGTPLPLIGHCLCWHGRRGTFDYADWLGAMQQAGENYLRLWMAPMAFGLEGEPGTLTRYRLDRAWQLDSVMQSAAEKGLYVMLCLDYHGMFETEPDYWGGNNHWPRNPYNAAQGGPCLDQQAFFTNAAAKATYQKRLRYLIARYGAFPNLLAWQFFNEIDNVYRHLDPARVAAWHGEMGTWLKANDPWKHLITTSLSGSDRPELWNLEAMDFVMHHSYAQPQPAATLPSLQTTLRSRYRKPVMIGEFGTDWRGWQREADPYLRGWRQGVWAGALGGSVGTTMSWWWEQIHAENLYPYYRAMGTFLRSTTWGRGRWSPLGFRTHGDPPTTLTELVAGGQPFTARLPLNAQWGAKLRGQLALASPLSATGASTYLNSFVHGSAHPDLRLPLRVEAWLGVGARMTLHVNSVSDHARLAVFRSGAKIFERSLPNLDGSYQVNHEYNTNYTVDLPEGHQVIEVRNTGGDWFYLDWIEFDPVLPATYSGNWQPSPIAAGLRGDAESLVYVVSPQVSFPAQATAAVIEPTRGAVLTITNLPPGRYQAAWYDPSHGGFVGETVASGSDGVLELPLPEFREDLAGRMRIVAEVSIGSPVWSPAGQFRAAVTGPAERAYQVEVSDSLRSWDPLIEFTIGTEPFSFHDPAAGWFPPRFYRARLLPWGSRANGLGAASE